MIQFLFRFMHYDLFIFTIIGLIYRFLKLIWFLQVEACTIQESCYFIIAINVESL